MNPVEFDLHSLPASAALRERPDPPTHDFRSVLHEAQGGRHTEPERPGENDVESAERQVAKGDAGRSRSVTAKVSGRPVSSSRKATPDAEAGGSPDQNSTQQARCGSGKTDLAAPGAEKPVTAAVALEGAAGDEEGTSDTGDQTADGNPLAAIALPLPTMDGAGSAADPATDALAPAAITAASAGTTGDSQIAAASGKTAGVAAAPGALADPTAEPQPLSAAPAAPAAQVATPVDGKTAKAGAGSAGPVASPATPDAPSPQPGMSAGDTPATGKSAVPAPSASANGSAAPQGVPGTPPAPITPPVVAAAQAPQVAAPAAATAPAREDADDHDAQEGATVTAAAAVSSAGGDEERPGVRRSEGSRASRLAALLQHAGKAPEASQNAGSVPTASAGDAKPVANGISGATLPAALANARPAAQAQEIGHDAKAVDATAGAPQPGDPARVQGTLRPDRSDTPAGRVETFDQIMDHTLRMVRMGDREVSLQLSPEHLGELKIRVVVAHGSVMASLVAQTQQARDFLESHQGRLQQALLDNGAETAHVDVSLGDSGHQGAGEPDPGRQAFSGRVMPPEREAMPAPQSVAWASVPASGRLSIRA